METDDGHSAEYFVKDAAVPTKGIIERAVLFGY